MVLTKLIVQLNYSSIPSAFDVMGVLYKKLTGKVAPSTNILVPNLQLNVEDQRMFVNVGGNVTNLSIVQPESEEDAVKKVAKVLNVIQDVIKLNKIDRIAVRTLWVEERTENIERLINLYKKHIFVDNELAKTSKDVGIYLTLKDTSEIINFTSGPMEKQQLIDAFLKPNTFDQSKLPANFIFVDYDYYLPEAIEYNSLVSQKLMERGIKFSKKHNEIIHDLFK